MPGGQTVLKIRSRFVFTQDALGADRVENSVEIFFRRSEAVYYVSGLSKRLKLKKIQENKTLQSELALK